MAPPRKSLPSPSGNHGSEDRLTGRIPAPIHSVPVEESSEETDGLDEIEISHFIDVLAEVALAVARRREGTES